MGVFFDTHQSIGYHLSSGPKCGRLIAHLFKNTILQLQWTKKKKPVLLNHATNNVSNSPAYKNYQKLNGNEKVLLYDPLHLLKTLETILNQMNVQVRIQGAL